MSEIKRFKVNLDPRVPEDLSEENWQKAEEEMIRQFDQWREDAEPNILAASFGRKTGMSLDPTECPHYVHMDVFVG
jgi:hypothetical protein